MGPKYNTFIEKNGSNFRLKTMIFDFASSCGKKVSI
jgi:hypothetical protein